jgi:low temperature requirement protein LtrA
MSAVERQQQASDEHEVTPLELFFDLVMVFAFTQVTRMIVDDPTPGGIVRGMLVLAALWWAWSGYAWLTSTINVDEGGVRLALLGSMAAMLGVALAVPGAFHEHALLFGVAYLVVRVLHLVLYAIVGRGDRDIVQALVRVVPSELGGASLLVLAAFLHDDARLVLWAVALGVDYFGPVVLGHGRGWRIAPEHFAERHGLIVMIALGESIIAIGVGAGFELVVKLFVAAGLGVVVVAALWWLYFDVAAIFARRRLMEASGIAQARLALHAYSYLHLPMVAGVVLFAFGLETTLHHVGDPLDAEAATALCGGTALYLLAQVAFLFRTIGRVFRRRTMAAGALIVLIPVALAVPALAVLAAVAAVCALVVAYEAVARREHRVRIRHPELVE